MYWVFIMPFNLVVFLYLQMWFKQMYILKTVFLIIQHTHAAFMKCMTLTEVN